MLGDARVDTVLPSLPDTNMAEITLTVPVRNAASAAQQVTVTAAFDNVRVSSTVTVPAGQQTDVVFTPSAYPQLRLTNPKLWWPNGYGDANLHDLNLTATIATRTSDHRTLRFGIRKIGYDYGLPITVVNDVAAQTVDVPSQQARYVRLQGGRRATGWGISLWTLSVVDSASPNTDLALNKTATASSVDNPGNAAQNAVDGNSGTRWSSAYTDDQWIQVDLGSVVAFDRLVLSWEQAYAATFTVQVSDDGTAWTDVKSVDNSPIPLTILVNGVKVFIRGGSWGWDELLRRMPPGPGGLGRRDAQGHELHPDPQLDRHQLSGGTLLGRRQVRHPGVERVLGRLLRRSGQPRQLPGAGEGHRVALPVPPVPGRLVRLQRRLTARR